MCTILAIETSSELASVALLHNGRTFAHEAAGVQTHSQTVLPLVQALLTQAGITLAQCDALAFGAGPGSFTGVRTACGVVQGLAFGVGLPVVPVVTLQAAAQACRELSGASDVLVVLDARMEEVYWAQYRYSDGWQAVLEPALSAPSGVLPQGPVTACGNGLSAYPSIFEGAPFSQGSHPAVMPHAVQVAQLAQSEFAAGRALHAREAQPIYLRNKVAYTTAERMARAAA
ncbi:tRNA (adenosine(37)-N6)-threonylcarbamoyltransferase complex dimerization subunit type 1 TsaB [Noviherbaspirillum sp. UKPF54]|uniref:tRNA (adenosine(37)-N6)-threonylcarbamoyltransferase complex dimerization subunit type 1 TsaB n=1 Tax=Noviherbaspirillum sp. UKPF54 TaxID=2601898 RepID=UPI0011B1B89E|nr:tRNA (adenosine(37)-N6)-threonylcarbamoyltransferase complex dimerization subunit type 1 TsaB [Noviherbaspirillum sp. UKPF54]QDZ27772.1 tRNA (adenosine(37)-N6)-threonylcarbamoyltransferase complex dimerization subunit type 1 TsaB [Noviherbaspirillum sp. UKPF54]